MNNLQNILNNIVLIITEIVTGRINIKNFIEYSLKSVCLFLIEPILRMQLNRDRDISILSQQHFNIIAAVTALQGKFIIM